MDLKYFFKDNQKKRENKRYAATKSLCDETGQPLEWEFRPISAEEMEAIQEDCTVDVPVPGKPGVYRPKANLADINRSMVCASCVSPDLHNAKLLDSYGAATPEELLAKMVQSPGEYTNLVAFVSELNGFSMQEDVQTAKNS